MDSSPLFSAFVTHVVDVPEGHAQWVHSTSAGDWFVVAHLAFFFLLLACFGWATYGIWRRTMRPAPHLQLIMEINDEQTSPMASVRPEGGEGGDAMPWEKAGDWWKKE